MKLAFFLGLLPVIAASPILDRRMGAVYPTLEELVTFETSVTEFSKPIPAPGGYQVVGAINPGTITGKINGVISGGTSAPTFVNNGTAIIYNIELYGKTDDGYPWFITETGSGLAGASIFYNYESIKIGGEYSYLATTFLLDALVVVPTQLGGANISGTIYTITS